MMWIYTLRYEVYSTSSGELLAFLKKWGRIIYKSITFVAFISATINANIAEILFSSSYQKDHVGTRTQEWASTATIKSQSVLAQSGRGISSSSESPAAAQVPASIEQEQFTNPSSYSIKHGGSL